jgi:amino acid transporter
MGESPKQTVFVREATGLTKNVSFLDAISMNVAWQTIGTTIPIIGFYTTLFPTMAGVNLIYGTIIGFLFVIPHMIIYTLMQRRMPRTGGDYVWMSRQMGPFLGSSIGLMGACLNFLAFIAIVVLSAVFAIGSVGITMGYMNMLGLAVPGNVSGADPVSQCIIGSIIFTILIALNIFAPRLTSKLLTFLTVLGMVGLVVAIAALLGAGRQGIVGYINSLGIKNTTYDSVAASYSGGSFDLNNTLMLMPYFFLFLFPWFNMSTIAGSELKGKNALNWSVPISAISVFLLTLASFGTLYYVAGFEFTNAALASPVLVFDYGLNFWTLAMGVSTPALGWFLGIVWILWNFAVLIVTIMAIARYIFSLSFDRFLPSKLAYVSPRYGSPVVALILELVVAVPVVAATVFYYGPLSALADTAVAPMIFFAFVGLSAALYGIKKETGVIRTTLAVAGILSALIFTYISYQFVALSSIYGGNTLSYAYVVGSFIAGVIIYFASKYYLKSKGLDLDMVYKQLPPE